MRTSAESEMRTAAVHWNTFEISRRGKKEAVPALEIAGRVVTVTGRFLRVAEVFDEYWLRKEELPDPKRIIEELRGLASRPDLFTFVERVPRSQARFDFLLEWDNFAVVPLESYENWFRRSISAATRRNIAASEKRGVSVQVSDFDDAYIRGVMAIYNETPIRQGRRFWHYGKDYEAVRDENGTYRDRSSFLAAYFENQMIGYCKVVWDKETAAIMQVLSMMAHRDKRPNNALIAAAVRECCSRGIPYLLYEHYSYGTKTDSSLTRFKHENGFVRMNVPKYFVPLTLKGRLALMFGFHRDLKERLPGWLWTWLVAMRARWYMAATARRSTTG
jgi:hypothetical protein